MNLFFALLVSSFALAIGLSIYDITVRELALSQTATQSQYAIYAADSGAECALYWDNKYTNNSTNNNNGSGSAFATSSADTNFATGGILCSGQDVAAVAVALSPATWPQSTTGSSATTIFTIAGATQAAPCTTVVVTKTGNPPATVITSHGYNTCIAGSLQLERVFQTSY